MKRQPNLTELMDEPGCDPVKLRRTYRQFRFVNRSLCSWKAIFRLHILPQMSDKNRVYTLLDIGSGLMDVGIYLRFLARKHHRKLEVTGIDPNPVVAQMLEEAPPPEGVSFEPVFAEDMVRQNQKFDFVISNHLIHHLRVDEIPAFLETVSQLTRKKAIMNDIKRHILAYVGFALLTWPLRYHSFLHIDGLRSVRRSYTNHELEHYLPEKWKTQTMGLFRLLAIYEPI